MIKSNKSNPIDMIYRSGFSILGRYLHDIRVPIVENAVYESDDKLNILPPGGTG